MLLLLNSHQALTVQVLQYGLFMRPEYLEGFSQRSARLAEPAVVPTGRLTRIEIGMTMAAG